MERKGNEIKKVVMTGGSGPIGLALIQKLLEEHVEVFLFQREYSFRSAFVPEHEHLHIEHYTLEQLKDYEPEENDYDVFFHLGWANTGKTVRNNIEEQSKNVRYSSYAVEAAHKFGCHTFIGVGSQAEYGRKEEPLTGDMFCEPESAYGIMKLCSCYATRMLCDKYGMRHIWPRVLSGYGKYDNDGSVLIANIVNSLHHRPLAFSKGEQIWDFVYMDDIANALYLIAKKGKNHAIYPIGSGKARPLKEYIKIMCDQLGEDVEKGLGKIPYSPDQIMYLEADSRELIADTGWKPQVEFEEGIRRVIDFHKMWDVYQ